MKRMTFGVVLVFALAAMNQGLAQMGGDQGGPGGPPPGGGAARSSGTEGGRQGAAATSPFGRVAVTDFPLSTKVAGRLTPANTVAHTASANGIVRTVFVKVGQRVGVGDRLFSVERDDLSGSYMPAIVTARIAGIVSAMAVKADGQVRGGDPGIVIIDTSSYFVTALLSDKDAMSVREGTEITAAVVGGSILQGRILARSPEPDYRTGLFTLTIGFPDSRDAYPGQFATVEVPLGTVRGIFLQQDLLQRVYGRYQVWVVDAADLLEARRVTIGAIYGDQVLIEEGLAVGERILLKRTGKEKAGSPAAGPGS